MLSVIRPAEGGQVLFGSYVDPAGLTADIPQEAIAVEALDTWTSPHTGARYPSGWQVRLSARPELGLPEAALRLEPVLPDQELAFERMPYWEGAVSATGGLGGRPVSGVGYVELTGYAR
jgi:predicted secreted hydrolase